MGESGGKSLTPGRGELQGADWGRRQGAGVEILSSRKALLRMTSNFCGEARRVERIPRSARNDGVYCGELGRKTPHATPAWGAPRALRRGDARRRAKRDSRGKMCRAYVSRLRRWARWVAYPALAGWAKFVPRLWRWFGGMEEIGARGGGRGMRGLGGCAVSCAGFIAEAVAQLLGELVGKGAQNFALLVGQ
jgi:hypothetical protein